MHIYKLLITIVVTVPLILYLNPGRDEYSDQNLGQQNASTVDHERFTSPVKLKFQAYKKLLETDKPTPVREIRSAGSAGLYYPALQQIELLEDVPLDEAYNGLQTMLADADPVVRVAALESMGNMSYRNISTTLLAALADSHPQVRIMALEALALQNDVSIVSNIEPRLFDQNQSVRVAAIDTLSQLENEDAVITLASLLSDSDVMVRRHAVNALGEIGGDNAILYLLQARYDTDEIISANAETILFELGYKPAN